jgi:hypothetical protein
VFGAFSDLSRRYFIALDFPGCEGGGSNNLRKASPACGFQIVRRNKPVKINAGKSAAGLFVPFAARQKEAAGRQKHL